MLTTPEEFLGCLNPKCTPVRLASIISPSAMVHAMLSFQLRSKALEESAPSSWPPAQGARV